MKSIVIEKITTLRNPNYPKIVWVLIKTNDGIEGIGETSYDPDTVEAFILGEASDYLIGKNPSQIDLHWEKLSKVGSHIKLGNSGEMRGLSAIDMALWDLKARRLGIPIYELLGGLSRDKIKVYNTCAGYSYGVNRQGSKLPGDIDYKVDQPYEDQFAFINDPVGLAESLLEEGYSAMKIWPFDQFVPNNDGNMIDLDELSQGAEPFRLIREKLKNKMEIMLELHSFWNLPSAVRIAKSVENYNPFWIEDPMPMDNFDTLAQFKSSTSIPTTASETVTTRWQFREMFEKRAVSICMFDISWVGGLSEAKKVSTMAESYNLPIATHDCVGPVTLAFSVQLSLNAPNTIIQETVRAFNNTWYKEIASNLPDIRNGYAHATAELGCGIKLSNLFLENKETIKKIRSL
ncbi:MAG: dehydratase [Chloroflexi bacterium]|nr:dehydratase [Chloroflexota bacterium]